MRRKPVKRVCQAQLDITARSFREGLPGMGSTVEWFGLDIRFTVNITETATWEIMLLADDGAVLNIDDENVIDNDGIHLPTPVATRIKLEKGPHNFRVRYFQGRGPDLALMLAWKKPGAAWADAVMMGLGPFLGREYAHDLVYDISRLAIEQDRPLLELLAAPERRERRGRRRTGARKQRRQRQCEQSEQRRRALDLGIRHGSTSASATSSRHASGGIRHPSSKHEKIAHATVGYFLFLEARTGIESVVRLCIVRLRQRQRYGGHARASFRQYVSWKIVDDIKEIPHTVSPPRSAVDHEM